jgi:hypothetical protein
LFATLKKGGDKSMNLVIQRDIEKLFADTENVKQTLIMFEKDHSVWARKREEKDLARLIERAKQLECDVCLMMSDCLSFGRYDGGKGVIEGMHHAYACLNSLFQDIKKVKGDLNGSYVHPDEIKQMEIDWCRFNKAVGQIQEHLEDEKPYISKEYVSLTK